MASGQSALYNSGGLQVHDQGQVGFHVDLINDNVFTTGESLVGFYGGFPLFVDGTVAPTFYDVEFFTAGDVILNVPVSVVNNANFVGGNVQTQVTDPSINLNFLQDAFFTGENDTSKVVGFAAVTDKATFSFPVGDAEQLRSLLLESEGRNAFANCAYFFEDPNNPLTYDQQFDTDNRVRDIGQISATEFWVLQGDVPSRITINWNARSNLANLANTPEEIIVVGYNLSSNQWVVLGNAAFGGDITEGFITSDTFVPNNYGAITFGTVPLPTDTFPVNNPSLGNYFLSPNGDGINDFLVIDGLEESPNNVLIIYNRLGQKVFERTNYVNEFNGFANTDNFVISRDTGLEEGIYYYIVTLNDLNLEYQGFLFLDR